MVPIPKASAQTIVFKSFLSSDHVTEATSKTIAITLSKAGGAFGNPHAGATNATEIASGWYSVPLDSTDTGTAGILAIRGTCSGVDDYGDRFFVVNANNGGLSALPDTAVSTNASLLTSGTGTAQITNASGQVTVATNNDKTGYTASTVSDKTGYALTAAYDAAKTASQAGDAMALTSNERNSVADALLNRDMSTGTDSGSTTVRTPRQALRFLRNKWAIATGTLTVYKEDDSTSSWTGTVSTTANFDPVTGNDPAGP